MQQNLKTTTYNDGTAISNVTDNTEWTKLTTPAYCWYDNDAATYKNTYGGLYNWYAVNTAKLCPSGWHVPSDDEWTTLINYLGGESIAGGKMKEAGTSHWQSPNTGADNSSGFAALPGGYSWSGSFDDASDDAGFWSATEYDASGAWYRVLYYGSATVYKGSDHKAYGFSVRCVKD
jgi:uncharacterized protein (TIGR02145 family)